MKKHRLVKITVRTREIISLRKDAADEIKNSVCPICHAPLATEKVVANAELMPAEFSDNQIKKLKGDL